MTTPDSIQRMQSLLAFLQVPYERLHYVHVTGTNGKGSTCAYLAAIAQAAGLKTGLFTSPHLWKPNERIKINQVDIPDTELESGIIRCKQFHQELSPFEIYLAVALDWFCRAEVDLVILEVGLGGRLDPTNCIPTSSSAITSIGLEHTELLGATLADIAYEKAGIIKPNSVCVTEVSESELLDVIQRAAQKQQATVITINHSSLQLTKRTAAGQDFNYRGYHHLHSPLLGDHQLRNAAIAIDLAEQLHFSESAIRQGLMQVHWPLRFEVLAQQPTIIADAGHNPHGLKEIVPLVNELFKDRHKILVLGCSYDKPYAEMVQQLAPLGDEIILTAAHKGISPDMLAEKIIQSTVITHSVEEALQVALKQAKSDDVILVLGGLYLAAEAKTAIGKLLPKL